MSYGKAFALIMVGVTVWGAFLAVGAYYYNHDVRRGAMVMGCVLAFLAFWGAMLYSRRRRSVRTERDAATP